MITWRKLHDRPLCVFRTKNDFCLTGRRVTSSGIDFEFPDSEYADDTAVLFESRNDLVIYIPLLLNHFNRFGMEVHVGDISLPDKPSKTEILFVSAPFKFYHDSNTFDDTNLSPVDLGDGKFIPITDRFCYLGRILSRDCKDTLDITNRIKRASNAFGALRKSIFSNANVSNKVKASVYESLVLPIALYGSESWCLTENLFNLLRLFHRNCVRAMCRVNLSHVRLYRISNEELLNRIGLSSIDSYITKRQLSWAGHVARMNFDRLPRKLLSSWVSCNRPRGAPEFTYGRGLKKALNKANVPVNNWFNLAQDRNVWKAMVNDM